jgi:hypothetical protein
MSDRQPTQAEVEAAEQAWDSYNMNRRANVPRSGTTILFEEATA